MNIKNALLQARKNKFAIPSVTINNLEMIKATIEVSNELDKYIILMASPSGMKYMGGPEVLKKIFDSLKEKYSAKKVFLHLDHSLDFDTCKKCVDLGFDSVMFDGSKLKFLDNVEKTKKVVEYAHLNKVFVEGEIGEVGGKEDTMEGQVRLSSTKEIKSFLELTKVDFLAASIGTVHGSYIKKPNINLRLLDSINDLKIPLVLHGSSGLPEKTIRELIKKGQTKININTQNQISMIEGLQKKKNHNFNDIRDIGNLLMDFYKKSLKKIIKLTYGIQ